jgi:hypothetical protein
MSESRSNIRIVSSGGSGGDLHLAGLNGEEMERMKGVFHGHSWFRMKNEGQTACFVWTYDTLPGPITDEAMLPFWRRATTEEIEMSRREPTFKQISFDEYSNRSLPSISIAHLCGHFYTENSYRENAEKLISYGFVCMRSQRDLSGQYYEIWYLASLYSAKGDLEAAIKIGSGKSYSTKLERALNFLRLTVVFGTLDVSIQRLAMPNPD